MRPLQLSLLSLLVVLARSAEQGKCPNGIIRSITYNTGLTPTVPNYEERRPLLFTAIEEVTARRRVDFICLQEVWYERDMMELLSAIKRIFPFHYSVLHKSVGVLEDPEFEESQTLCGTEDLSALDTLKSCVEETCSTLTGLQQAFCAFQACPQIVNSLSNTCKKCIVFSSKDMTTIMQMCANPGESKNRRMNSPGLVVASRKPMTASYVPYHPGVPTFLERGYIKVQVDGAPAFACTHLTANLGKVYIEAATSFSSYEEQNMAEVVALTNAFSSVPHVILGDLNTGPKKSGKEEKNLVEEMPANYEYLVSQGYSNPYLNLFGKCSSCGKPERQRLIDHILTKNVDYDKTQSKLVTTPWSSSVKLSPLAVIAMNSKFLRATDPYNNALKAPGGLHFLQVEYEK